MLDKVSTAKENDGALKPSSAWRPEARNRLLPLAASLAVAIILSSCTTNQRTGGTTSIGPDTQIFFRVDDAKYCRQREYGWYECDPVPAPGANITVYSLAAGRNPVASLNTSSSSAANTVLQNGRYDVEITLDGRSGSHEVTLDGRKYLVRAYFNGDSICFEADVMGAGGPSCYPPPSSSEYW
jgi:hypothetical protein